MTFLAITNQTWEMAGISIGVVFGILVLLVFVLYIFSWVNSLFSIKRTPRVLDVNEAPEKPLAAGKPADNAEDENLAAVAVAVHLFLSRAHDDESGVLTITHGESAGWHAELNPRL